MIRLSHFAAPAVLGTAMFLGVQGCAHDRGDEIPAAASEIASGKESVTATAPHDGMVYVWDQNANKELYTARVNKGDIVRVDAKENKIFLNDKLITKRDDLTNDHRYKVFFDQSELDRARDASWRETHSSSSSSSMTAQPAAQQPAPQVNVHVTQPPAPAAQPQTYQQTYPQTYPQQQRVAQPAPGTTVYTPSPSNPNTTVVVPDSETKSSGTTVVVPEPNR